MNQNFSFKRYLWLVKRQWFENAATYKWGIILMVLVICLAFLLPSDWKTVENPRLHQWATIPFVAIFFLYIYGGWFFDRLSSKRKGMFYFSLPVTPLERVVVAFTFVMILFPVILLSVFTVFDFIFVQLFNHIHGTSEQMLFNTTSIKDIGLTYGGIGLTSVMLLGYLSNASILMLGSLMFGKKGPVISIIFVIAFSFIFLWLWCLFFSVARPVNNVSDYINFFFYFSLSPSVAIEFTKSNILIYIVPLMIWWVLMFFVMKKKEA